MANRKIKSSLTQLCAGVAIISSLLLSGCAQPGYATYRPGVSSFQPGDQGLQSRDLVDMTNRLAADLLKIPEIAQNPNKVIIVMTGIDNKTSQPWQNDQIYLARMRALLNQYARDRIAFVIQPQELQQLQQQELGGAGGDAFEQSSRGQVPQNTRMIPQYALKGVFYDLPNSATTYYLCTFQLVNLRTGELVWEGHYETRTLNLY
jgi:PBP1b-binding outer membrane lipoprotein LpoB